MQEVYVNGSDFANMEEVHEYLAEELDFPGYYGKNLSALYDVLTDISEETKIIMDLSYITDGDFLREMERMAEVMEDAAGDNEVLEIECIE